jgi:hypothetical protein
MFSLGLLHAEEKVTRRVALIKKELKAKNYNPIWITISQKRNRYYNNLLPNSVNNSYHIQGMAIDLFVFDIDGDYKYNLQDVEIIKEAALEVERKNPELKGGLLEYKSSKRGFLTQHMIHIDARGYSLQRSMK